jgi:hypothetical protein
MGRDVLLDRKIEYVLSAEGTPFDDKKIAVKTD